MSERDPGRTDRRAEGPARTPPGTPGRDEGPSLTQFAGLGLQLAIAILLFLYVGRWLDAKLGTAPWLLILGVFVGAGAGFFSMYRKLTEAQRREDAARRSR